MQQVPNSCNKYLFVCCIQHKGKLKITQFVEMSSFLKKKYLHLKTILN